MSPTLKQQLAWSKYWQLVKTDQVFTFQEVMLYAGYSESAAKHPKENLLETKGWKEMEDKFMPDEYLIKKHRSLLEACSIKRMYFPTKTCAEEIKQFFISIRFRLIKIVNDKRKKIAYYLMPDYSTQIKALDTAYKIKGKYRLEKYDYELSFKSLSTEELREQLADSIVKLLTNK